VEVKDLALDPSLEFPFIERLMKNIHDAEKAHVGSHKVLDTQDKSNKSKEQLEYVKLMENMIEQS
jgi:hypothetical protein